MGGRFLKSLQESIEGILCNLVSFINDIDFESAHGGRELNIISKITDVIDSTVTGGIEFDHIHAVAFGDRQTNRALITRFAILRILAVDRFGEDTGCGCFPYSSRAAKEIGIGEAASTDRVP